jgi:S-adenosylmethionine uptake transporter
MVLASFLFATMGVCVKLASARYGTAEIVLCRSLVGAALMGLTTHWQGGTLRTRVPAMHAWRAITGVTALCLWFYAIGGLPIATAMTLNYMSSVWMALFLLGGAVMLGTQRVDGRLILTVLLGFAGVAMILRPTIEANQLWHGLIGMLSGVISATAYLQVAALARAGEPEVRIVFYFSLGGVVMGGLGLLWSGWQTPTLEGLALLLGVGVLASIAQVLMTRAYAIGRPLVNASLQYLGIAFSFLYGVLIFDDRVTAMALVGMALIVVAGVGAAQWRARALAHARDTVPPDSTSTTA